MIRKYLFRYEMTAPGPLKIVWTSADGKLQCDREGLEGFFSDERIKDKQVAVFSIAGAARKGKSFILNFMLKYLKSEVSAAIQ